MIEVVINYDTEKQFYKIYEPSTDTILISSNISEALINLSKFLLDQKLTEKDILNSDNITYHLDSHTMRAMIESNVKLIKRLNSAPSGFTISTQRFGGSSVQKKPIGKQKDFSKNSNITSDKSSFKKNAGKFSGASGFKMAGKKFGSKY